MERSERGKQSPERRLAVPARIYCGARNYSGTRSQPLPSTNRTGLESGVLPSSNVSGDPSVVSQICRALRNREDELSQVIDKVRIEGNCCLNVLRNLEREEYEWRKKLKETQKRVADAKKQKAEAELLLELHRTLGQRDNLHEQVKNIQKTLSTDIPEDVKVMVDDCLNQKKGVHMKECVVCLAEFTAEDLLSVVTVDKCRYVLYPCGHAVVCGLCAKKLWLTTRRCPLCRAKFIKKPEIFKPGRWHTL